MNFAWWILSNSEFGDNPIPGHPAFLSIVVIHWFGDQQDIIYIFCKAEYYGWIYTGYLELYDNWTKLHKLLLESDAAAKEEAGSHGHHKEEKLCIVLSFIGLMRLRIFSFSFDVVGLKWFTRTVKGVFFFFFEVLENDIAVQNEYLKSRPTRFMEKLSYVHNIDVPCKHVLTAGIYDHPVLNSRHIIIFTILTSSAVSRRSYYGRGRSSTVVAVVVYYPRRSSPPSVPAGPSLVSTAAAAASLPKPAAAGLPACIRSERGEDPLAAPNGFFLIIKACGACNQNAVRLEADNSVAQQQR